MAGAVPVGDAARSVGLTFNKGKRLLEDYRRYTWSAAKLSTGAAAAAAPFLALGIPSAA